MNEKAWDAIDELGTKIINIVNEHGEAMALNGFNDAEILASLSIGLSISAVSCVASLSRSYPNYKARHKYLNHFKDAVDELVKKAKILKQEDVGNINEN
jgi:hypothetical protein